MSMKLMISSKVPITLIKSVSIHDSYYDCGTYYFFTSVSVHNTYHEYRTYDFIMSISVHDAYHEYRTYDLVQHSQCFAHYTKSNVSPPYILKIISFHSKV